MHNCSPNFKVGKKCEDRTIKRGDFNVMILLFILQSQIQWYLQVGKREHHIIDLKLQTPFLNIAKIFTWLQWKHRILRDADCLMTNIKMFWDYISKHHNFYFCENASSAKCNPHWMYFPIIFHECPWIGAVCEYNKGALLSLKIRNLTAGKTTWHFQRVLSS